MTTYGCWTVSLLLTLGLCACGSRRGSLVVGLVPPLLVLDGLLPTGSVVTWGCLSSSAPPRLAMLPLYSFQLASLYRIVDVI
jgi:hypothetical protein